MLALDLEPGFSFNSVITLPPTMNTSNSDIRSLLNILIATCKDGQAGFRAASEHVDKPRYEISLDIKRFFRESSLQRSKFVGELQEVAHDLGESDPEDSGSASGAAHRGWINLEASLIGNDHHAMLVECERGEHSAVAEYKKALETELPKNIREIVERQYLSIQATYDRVKELRGQT